MRVASYHAQYVMHPRPASGQLCSANMRLANACANKCRDDHDIVDGFGSYSQGLQSSPIFQQWYQAARKFFMLFQLHASPYWTQAELKAAGFVAADASGSNPLSQVMRLSPRSLMVVLDLRSDRTLSQMMSQAHRTSLLTAVDAVLNSAPAGSIKHLMIMSGVPLVFPKLPNVASNLEGMGPYEALDLDDDIADGWSFDGGSRGNHLTERNLLVTQLQQVRAFAP